MSWYMKRALKTLIAGMFLTRNEALILIQAYQELELFMTLQTEELEAILNIWEGDDASRALTIIQERHCHIYKRLDVLALCLRNNHSKKPLRRELEEMARSMARKRLLWSYHSNPLEIGWKAAAEQYWPRIADSYAVLLEILGSFKQDLEHDLQNEALWSDEARERNRSTCLGTHELFSQQAEAKVKAQTCCLQRDLS
ncbi:hypothetical protein G6011_02109 [Alternaria panax]|uniref:Uncharacterized protein n=1 Tax=Alternaria panax TaxID=48097 RepID=A0AAD4I8S0_9PLEO|nr:hypothetical protein G6011_02109 [Alternaria panax]